MKCPSCDHGEMMERTQDEKLSFGGQSLTLHGMKGEFCTNCDEGVWDAESYRRYTEAQAALLRAVKSDLSTDIRRIRKNLKLTQAELSKVFGVGKLAFSRYERGKTQPPAPLVKLLKLVERHPDLMNEVREDSTSYSLIDRSARISGNQQAG
ncbi:MAG: XRE family transcriptional regulator [Syntrophobacterales bacterium CG_4_8_14_3_um_filter_58_8]|nr:MAG: XRE family transcriptional regulator [Syntrophobacterales bacterium CG_4_8_14_3_um_filter_58_8]